jgi:hypothetical protein
MLRNGGISEVPAAAALEQVAADRCHVAQLDGRPEEQGLPDKGQALDHVGVGGQLLHGGQCSHPQGVVFAPNAVQGQARDVHESLDLKDAVLQHQVHQRGATGQVGARRVGAHRRNGLPDVRGAGVVELPHRQLPRAATARVFGRQWQLSPLTSFGRPRSHAGCPASVDRKAAARTLPPASRRLPGGGALAFARRAHRARAGDSLSRFATAPGRRVRARRRLADRQGAPPRMGARRPTGRSDSRSGTSQRSSCSGASTQEPARAIAGLVPAVVDHADRGRRIVELVVTTEPERLRRARPALGQVFVIGLPAVRRQ